MVTSKKTAAPGKKASAKTTTKAAAAPDEKPAAAPRRKAAPSSAGEAFQIPSLEDVTDLAKGLKLPKIDLAALAEWQRKDMEALIEANREAYAGVKALVERRNEVLRETFAQVKEGLQNPADKLTLSGQAEAAKAGLQQAMAHLKELSEMEAQTRKKTWAVVQDRMQENMANLQKLLKPGK